MGTACFYVPLGQDHARGAVCMDCSTLLHCRLDPVLCTEFQGLSPTPPRPHDTAYFCGTRCASAPWALVPGTHFGSLPPRCHVDCWVFSSRGCPPSPRIFNPADLSSEVRSARPRALLAPKRRIGGSGTSASFLRTLPLSLYLGAANLVVSFFLSLLLMQLLALCKMFLLRTPGPMSPIRRAANPVFQFYPWRLVLCWDIGSAKATRPAVLDWRPTHSSKGRKIYRGTSGVNLFLRLGVLLLGCAHLPHCVWAAPTGFTAALHAAHEVIEGLPDPLPPDLNMPADVPISHARQMQDDARSAERQLPKHCVIFQAGFPAQHLLVYERLPCPEQAFIRGAAELQTSSMDDHTLHPTEPQITPGLATLVAVPNWMHNTDQTVYVLDFSFWDGPVFAVADWRFVTVNSLAAAARRFCPVPWQVRIGRHDVPFPVDGHIFAVPGDVFRFTPQGHPTSPRPSLQHMLDDASAWNDNR